MRKITIYQVDNGFIVKEGKEIFVIEGEEAPAIKDLALHVINLFDHSSRYSDERVHVVIMPGDKSESAKINDDTLYVYDVLKSIIEGSDDIA